MYRFFHTLPKGAEGGENLGDTPETPPRGHAPEPRCKNPTLERERRRWGTAPELSQGATSPLQPHFQVTLEHVLFLWR